MTQHTSMYMHCMLASCLTQTCEALIYSSTTADCCCSKAVYWPRPTLMLHPSNAAAAWPTFFACHTVATVPVSGRQAQRAAKQLLEFSYTKSTNSKCSINSNSQNKSLMMRIYSWDIHGLAWKHCPELRRTQADRFLQTQLTWSLWMTGTYCVIRLLFLVLYS